MIEFKYYLRKKKDQNNFEMIIILLKKNYKLMTINVKHLCRNVIF